MTSKQFAELNRFKRNLDDFFIKMGNFAQGIKDGTLSDIIGGDNVCKLEKRLESLTFGEHSIQTLYEQDKKTKEPQERLEKIQAYHDALCPLFRKNQLEIAKADTETIRKEIETKKRQLSPQNP